ncbi:MAG: hypothetical protein AB8I08_40165 [Sandaracinaceae bacterium]
MSRVERSWAKETARDLDESAFTPILRRLLYRQTGILTVCFVDGLGECVDYCSALDPFDSKVLGAHMLVVVHELSGRMHALGAGESFELHVHGEERDILARRVGDDYILVLGLKPKSMSRRLLGGVEHAVSELRREAGLDVPSWEPVRDSVRVEVREAVGWPYAPASFVAETGEPVAIDDVMGRWTEGTGQNAVVCFRVRTVDGQELTLLHDRAHDRWERQHAGLVTVE